MAILENLALFVAIAEKGGMAAAGRELGLSPASVTQRLAALEAEYGVVLIRRTTRSLSLTEEGKTLLEGARSLLTAANELGSKLRAAVCDVVGNVKLTVPVDLGRQRLVPIVNQFVDDYPNVSIDIDLSDSISDADLSANDLAIRHGHLRDSRLVCYDLGPNRRIVCASPSYLNKYGVPQHPAELENHSCILLRLSRRVDRDWPFLVDGRQVRYSVKGRYVTNHGDLVRTWCLAGRGLAYKSVRNVEADINLGDLVPVLEDFSIGDTGIYLVHRPNADAHSRVRLLSNRIVEHFRTNRPSI